MNPVAVLAADNARLVAALDHIAAGAECEADFFHRPHCYELEADPACWCDHCVAVVALAAHHLGRCTCPGPCPTCPPLTDDDQADAEYRSTRHLFTHTTTAPG